MEKVIQAYLQSILIFGLLPLHKRDIMRPRKSSTSFAREMKRLGKKQTIPHTCGAETLARRHELKIETGKTVDRGPMWNMTHKRKDGSYVNDKAMEIGEIIENHISQGLEASSEFPGHVQGLGLGVVPTIAFKHTTTRHSGMRFDSSSGCTSSGDLQQKVIKMESQMQALIAYICAKEGGRIPKELASLFPNSTQQASDVGSGASSGGSNTHLVDHQGPPNGI